jgi:hypothetical protein
VYQTLVPKWSAFHRNEPASRSVAAHEIMGGFTEESCGWPLISLRGTRTMLYSLDFQSVNIRREWQLSLGNLVFPLRPIWPGFAINTLFYAGILWLLLAAPFTLRRRRRIKRGLCAACAYPVGASEICTECGKAVISTRSGA